jgi:DNA-binding CsgD family transcriptional regulator
MMVTEHAAASAVALFEQSGFGLAIANAAQIVTFAAGTPAEMLPVGTPLCETYAPLRGMERKIAGLREKVNARLTIPSLSIVKDAFVSEKSSLLIAWDDETKLYTVCFYPSHDEAERKLAATLRLKRISDEIMRSGTMGEAPPKRRTARGHAPIPLIDRLTPREREVVTLLASGQTNKGAARILGLSAKTIEAHRARALKRLNVKTTADLIRVAIEGGLSQLER